MTIRDIGFLFGFKVDKASEAKVEDSIKGLKDTASRLLGAIGIGFSLTQINGLVEEFSVINRGIRSSVEGLGDVEEAERLVLRAANESRTTYGAMSDIVSDLVKSSSELFPIEDAVNFSSTVTKLLKTSGRSDQEIQSMMEGLNKSFQKGIVDTETLNVMLEQCPEAANLLSKSLGVAKSQLLDMASSGRISVVQLKNAFLDASGEISNDFDNMSLSVTEALVSTRNSWGYLLSDFDRAFGVTNAVARTIVSASDTAISVVEKVKTRLLWLAERLGGTNKLLRLVAISAGAILLALNGDKLMSVLKGVGGLLKAGNLKLMAIVSVIVLLALLVEDFFSLLRGENSLIGTLLEEVGVDVEQLRTTVGGLFEQLKNILPAIGQLAKAAGGQLLAWIKQLLPLLNRFIAYILPLIADWIKQLLPIIKQLAQLVLSLVIERIKQLLSFMLQLGRLALPLIRSLLEQLMPFLKSIIEQILPTIISLIELLLSSFAQINDSALPLIISLIERLLPLVMQLINDVLPIILELILAIVPVLFEIIEAILPAVLDVLSAILPLLQPVIELVLSLAQTLLPSLVTLLKAILPILKPILAMLEPIASVLGTIIEAIAKVVGWAADGLGWVVDLFSGKDDNDDKDKGGEDEPERGTDGVATPKRVKGYAKGTDITPDTFIAGEEGPELITGQAGKKVFTALETGRIFEAMAMLGRAAVARPSTITNSSSSSRIINQYNSIANTFNGDRAGQAKSSDAMKKASEDATSQMARALAFAR